MPKVLVVENNPTILKLISHHLEAANCQVQLALNGLEALVEIDKDPPDIILTDIIMPKISGDQLCSIIRNSSKYKDIFIAVHSSTSLEDNRKILEMDADVYIAKGPQVNLKEHVIHVLKQYQKGERRDQRTISKATFYPREITTELLLARKHHQAIFDNVVEAVVELDSGGQIVQANMAAKRLFGKSDLEILSNQFPDFLSDRRKKEVNGWLKKVRSGDTQTYRTSYSSPLLINGRKIRLNLVAVEELDDFFIIGILQDITLQKNVEARLAQTLEEFRAVIDTIDYGILLLDKDLKVRISNQAYNDLWQIPQSFTDISPSFREILEYTSNSGIYNVPPEELSAYIDERIAAIRQGEISSMELERTDGKVLQYKCTILPDDGRLLTYYDITDLKNTEKKLEAALKKVSDLANHDALTGLPNIRLARERLLNALSLAKRKNWMAALLFIDLDGFKEVNDSHGHEFGDQVLKEAGGRLAKSLRQVDTVARIGGDEFLVIQTEVRKRSDIVRVAEKIIEKVSQPFTVEGKEIYIGASIGISIYPNHGSDIRELLKKADDAMYYTKRLGKNSYSFSSGNK